MSSQARIAMRIIFQMAMFVLTQLAQAKDTLQQGDKIHDYDRLKSFKDLFELGFFSIDVPAHRYLGIWFGGITTEQTVVWVANKESPITDTSGYLTIDITHGTSLMVSDQMGNNITLFSDFIAGNASKNLTLKLLDSGNLVLRDEHTGQLLWQSIDHPCNAFLPGMKLGINKRTGQVRQLTSWLNPYLPAPGAFTLGADFNGTKQLVVHQRGEAIWRSGTWDGNDFTFLPWIKLHLNFSFVSSDDEHYFVYHDENSTSFSIWVMNSTGEIVQYASRGDPEGWYVFGLQSIGSCASHKMPLGCLGTLASNCSFGNEFAWWSKTSAWDLDDYDRLNSSSSLSDCEALCRMDCSCAGYTTIYDNHTGCYLMSKGSLPKQNSVDGQHDVYSRLFSGEIFRLFTSY